MKRGIVAGVAVVAMAVIGPGCGSSSRSDQASSPAATTAATHDMTTEAIASNDSTGGVIVNTWVGPAVDLTTLPIGTPHVSTTEAAIGNLFVCNAGNPNGGGAFKTGPWIDESAGTWDATQKVAVQGAVSWPMATYDEVVNGATRTISSNGLPIGMVSGTFPIADDDPAYAYDRNPNSIAPSKVSVTLPVSPSVRATPKCLPKGTLGVLKNGVALFAPVDERNRDAVAYETQDQCDGHPQQSSTYHYHDVPSCVLTASTGSETVVGFADDGYPIVVERDAAGQLPTNADLDACHGRVSPILLEGSVTPRYHYSATYEFPYFIGCFHGDPV